VVSSIISDNIVCLIAVVSDIIVSSIFVVSGNIVCVLIALSDIIVSSIFEISVDTDIVSHILIVSDIIDDSVSFLHK